MLGEARGAGEEWSGDRAGMSSVEGAVLGLVGVLNPSFITKDRIGTEGTEGTEDLFWLPKKEDARLSEPRIGDSWIGETEDEHFCGVISILFRALLDLAVVGFFT